MLEEDVSTLKYAHVSAMLEGILDHVSKSTGCPQAAPISSNFLLLTLAEISPGKPMFSRLPYSRPIVATHSDQSGHKCDFNLNCRTVFQF